MLKRSGIVIMWSNQLEIPGHNVAHRPPLMPFSKKVVSVIRETHPEIPQCVNTESDMLVVQRALE